MSLTLQDLIKKAKEKGISSSLPVQTQLLRPWQQDSSLFNHSAETQKETWIKTDNKPQTKRQQTGNKQEAIWEQKETKKQQIDNKEEVELATVSATKWQQKDNKQVAPSSFSSLVGLQRALVIFIYNACKSARSNTTEALTLEYIRNTLNASAGCIKTTLQRLETKCIIQRVEYKNGRGGWSRYSIPDILFQELLRNETENKVITNWQQIGIKPTSQVATQPITALSSSSINNINRTTTEEINYTFEEWENINIRPLEKIGFTKTHLLQIASQNKLLPKDIQTSIYAFAFDLDENSKGKSIKGEPINFFMGIVRNGKPYIPPSNYESPEDRTMRIYLEKMRQIEQSRIETEKEAMNLAFNDWFYKLTEEQKLDFLPIHFQKSRDRGAEGNKILESIARNHFEKNIWLDIKNNKINNHIEE